MARELEHIAVKLLIAEGKIERFSDIEGYITKEALATPMCISYHTLENRFNNSGMMRMDEFFRLAKALDMEPSELIKIFGPGKTSRRKKE